MINESHASQDVQAFQRDVALDRLSLITEEQARRRVTITDEDEPTIEKTLKQTADLFMQNLVEISKVDKKDEQIDIKPEVDVEKPKNDIIRFREDDRVRETPEGLKGEKLIKTKQRGSIVTARRTSLFRPSDVPATLGAATLQLRRKSLHLEPVIPPERPEVERPPLKVPSKELEELEELEEIVEIAPPIDLLTSLEAAAISCVLEECLEQLVTIGFLIPANVDPRWDETFKTIDEMYGMFDEPKTIFREDMGLLSLVPTAAEKMQRDRNYVCKVLERVLCDIRDNRKFDSLQKEIDQITKKREDEHSLEVSAQVWLGQTNRLRDTLEYNKTTNKENTERTMKLAQESDAQVDHTIFVNSGKLGYAERWAKARWEQQDLKLQLQKTDLLNKWSEHSKEYNAEQIISAEMNVYLETDIEEKEKQILTWTARYNEDLVQKQQEVDDFKEEVEKQKLILDELRPLRDQQLELLSECIAEEKRIREELEHHTKLYNAATLIQSTWKGYMVRHELGKYKNLRKRLKRRKEKKGKKKKIDAKTKSEKSIS